MANTRSAVPRTPRVISPTPTPTESGARDGYFGPVTRSSVRTSRAATPAAIFEEENVSPDPDRRARTRSRSPVLQSKKARVAPLTNGSTITATKPTKRKPEVPEENGEANGHLQPPSANMKYFRSLSRSPSPSGLIPIHSTFRQFVSSLFH